MTNVVIQWIVKFAKLAFLFVAALIFSENDSFSPSVSLSRINGILTLTIESENYLGFHLDFGLSKDVVPVPGVFIDDGTRLSLLSKILLRLWLIKLTFRD